MHFVDDVDFVFPFCRGNDGFFADFADIVDASVRGGIYFNDVKIIILNGIWQIIDSVSKNARDGGFASTAGADEKISVTNLALFD